MVCPYFNAISIAAYFWALLPPSPSIAPDIFRLSNTRLFTACKFTLAQKLKRESNSPCLFLVSMICSNDFVPTFLIAFKPNEIVFLSTGRKLISDILTSGGFTSIFSFRHSLIRITIRSIFDISLVRFALMNSAG